MTSTETTTSAPRSIESTECHACAYDAPFRTAPMLMEDCPTPFAHGLYSDQD